MRMNAHKLWWGNIALGVHLSAAESAAVRRDVILDTDVIFPKVLWVSERFNSSKVLHE